jgi:pectin methylesterase-like acyl-CoA thioesterase
MSIRVRRPATDRLELSDGDYLIVKRDLTAGEFRELMRAASKPVTIVGGGATTLDLDPIAASVAMVQAYLLDWSFADADGRKIVIADQPASVVKAALDHIDGDAYTEVQAAINAHQAARAAALAEEKKTRPGVNAPDRILTSVE